MVFFAILLFSDAIFSLLWSPINIFRNNLGWITGSNAMSRNVGCNNTIGRDNCTFAYCNTLSDTYIRTYPHMVANYNRCFIFISLNNDMMTTIVITYPNITTNMHIITEQTIFKPIFVAQLPISICAPLNICISLSYLK